MTEFVKKNSNDGLFYSEKKVPEQCLRASLHKKGEIPVKYNVYSSSVGKSFLGSSLH